MNLLIATRTYMAHLRGTHLYAERRRIIAYTSSKTSYWSVDLFVCYILFHLAARISSHRIGTTMIHAQGTLWIMRVVEYRFSRSLIRNMYAHTYIFVVSFFSSFAVVFIWTSLTTQLLLNHLSELFREHRIVSLKISFYFLLFSHISRFAHWLSSQFAT